MEHVLGPARGFSHAGERSGGLLRVATGAHTRGALELAPLCVGVDRLQLDRELRLGCVFVHADDHALTRLDLLLPLERGVLDLALDEALLDCRDTAAELIDPLDQLPGARFELVGQRFDVVRPAERIGGHDRSRLVLQDLLRAQRDRRRPLGRERERLVVGVRVQRLRAAGNSRERLDRDAHDVVLGLLRGQGRATGLCVEAQRKCLWVRRAEPLAHHTRPDATRGAELRDLLEEVVVRVEEERQPCTELVGRLAGLDRGGAIRDPVGNRERELLHRRRAGFADVVPGDRDRVPGGDPLRAVREQVGRQPHRRARREDVVPPRDVLLEDVVLHRPAECRRRNALLLRDQLVEQQEQPGGRVDRHRRRHGVERDPAEEDLHVRDRVDRHAGAPDLAECARIVGVHAELRRQVERDRKTGLAVLEQVAVARVRLLGRGEARVLAHRPRPTAVHVGVRPARVRELAGQLDARRGVLRRVDRLDLDP